MMHCFNRPQLAKLFGVHPTRITQLIAGDPTFPKPDVKLGVDMYGWDKSREKELLEWFKQRTIKKTLKERWD